jgi:hypothetical protein
VTTLEYLDLFEQEGVTAEDTELMELFGRLFENLPKLFRVRVLGEESWRYYRDDFD